MKFKLQLTVDVDVDNWPGEEEEYPLPPSDVIIQAIRDYLDGGQLFSYKAMAEDENYPYRVDTRITQVEAVPEPAVERFELDLMRPFGPVDGRVGTWEGTWTAFETIPARGSRIVFKATFKPYGNEPPIYWIGGLHAEHTPEAARVFVTRLQELLLGVGAQLPRARFEYASPNEILRYMQVIVGLESRVTRQRDKLGRIVTTVEPH